MTIQEAIQIGVGHHRAGRLAEAEAIYRQVLAQVPDHADALQLLGVLAGQSGRIDAAIELIGRAITIDSKNASFHGNIGEFYRRSGDVERAISHLCRAIELQPELVVAHISLGDALKASGQLDRAVGRYRRAIELQPDSAGAYLNLATTLQAMGRLDDAIVAFERAGDLNRELVEIPVGLGNVLKARGRIDEAIAAYGRAIALSPGSADAYNNRGVTLHEAGRIDLAIDSLSQAARLRPDRAEIQANLGNSLRAGGRLAEAIAAYRRAITLRPDFAEAHNNLGIALHEVGHHDEAIAAFGHAIAMRPDYAEAHSNLGAAFADQGRLDEAIAALERAVMLKPDYVLAYNNLGNALWQRGRLDEAIRVCSRAIQMKPDYAEPHCNLGNVYKDQGRLDEALASFCKAIELNPACREANSSLLATLYYHPKYDAQAILAEHRKWARQLAEPRGAPMVWHDRDRSPARKLRIGYLSPDFRDHAVGHMLLPLLSYHDRRDFEIVCYSNGRVADDITEKLKSLSSGWQNTVGLGDEPLAAQILQDKIDILVDLALHTANSRVLLFARKPAPVQVTMLGMPATTGLDQIDYRLTDPYLDPPGLYDADYTERSVRLPHCFWIYQPPEEAPSVGALPALSNGFITFGCLNQFSKVSHPALQLWVKVLQALPGARLVLQSSPGNHLDAVHRLFREAGVAGDRVEFTPRAPRAAYLQRYCDLDLGLDPFPYNGHTSTLDALWMGVPVVTLAGRTAVGRGGVSILSNLGLPELIARTPEQYVDIAIAWARDEARLATLRSELRPRMKLSPLVDARQYAVDVEAAFRGMWKTWCGQG